MTLIECFDTSHIENIIGCLCLRPQRVIFIGDEAQMEKHVERYKRLLKKRGQTPDVFFHNIQEDEPILQTLIKIIEEENDDCIIDFTGGDEDVVFEITRSLSALSPEQRKKLSLQKFNFKNGSIIDYDKDGHIVSGVSANLTVEELIELYGGIVYPRSAQPSSDLTPDDINPLWDCMRRKPQYWNKLVSALNRFEKGIEGDFISFKLSEKSDTIADFENQKVLFREILTKLRLSGIITDRSGRDEIKYEYKSPIFHHCVNKAGNLLEIKSFLEARSIKDENGQPFFNDSQVSVNIDWDGDTGTITKNEIDLILIRNYTPIFISCKNGEIEEVEIYKLDAVTSRFGGEYAKKMIISTKYETKQQIPKGLIQRAKDMNTIIECVSSFDRNEWEKALKAPFSGSDKTK